MYLKKIYRWHDFAAKVQLNTIVRKHVLSISILILLAIGSWGPMRVSAASNTGCDWTGSGLSTIHTDRQVISIYLRCTAGRIVWKYPRGAIRVQLSKPVHLPDNYRACLRVYPQQQATKSVRIYLEAPRRLISLFGSPGQTSPQSTILNDADVLVKCFRSVNGQVALYMEADDTPFETVQADIKYNIEFINNKHYSLRPTATTGDDSAAKMLIERNRHVVKYKETSQSTLRTLPKPSSKIWSMWNIPVDFGSRLLSLNNVQTTTESNVVVMPLPKPLTKQRRYFLPNAVDENIIDGLGESYDICRPCTPDESAHAFCSSEIVVRGSIFGIQQRPQLATNEVFINQTYLLRNNLIDLPTDAEKMPSSTTMSTTALSHNASDGSMVSFHTPLHCSTSHESGEFVFMGRRRFEEMMVICAPSLKEWAQTVNHMKQYGDEPCILSYR